MAQEAGGWSGVQHPVPEKLKTVTDSFKADAEKIIGHVFLEFVPLSYRTQIVAGTRYLVSVQVAKDYHFAIEVEIFEDLDGKYHFVNAYPLFAQGQKAASHAAQHTEYTPAPAGEESSGTSTVGKISAFIHDKLHLGTSPAKSATIPLGPGPVVPPSSPIVPISGWKPVNKGIIEIAEKEKAAAEALLKTTFKVFVPVEYAQTVSFSQVTYYIAVETSELPILVLGEPKPIKFYTELTVIHYNLLGENRLVNAVPLPNGLPINPRIGPIGQEIAGGGGQLQGPYVITAQLGEAVVNFKADVEKYLGETFNTFKPQNFYTQIVAGTNYFVYVVTGNLLGSYIFVELYLGLTPASKYQFVRAGTHI